MKTKNERISKALYWIAIVLLMGLFCLNLYYIHFLEKQVDERDNLIREMSFRSDLVDEFFDIKYDSIGHTTSYTLKSSKANYVIMQQDSTEMVFYKGNRMLSAKELVDEYNDLLKHYNELAKDYNRLVKDCNREYNENMRQIQELNTVLEKIEKTYEIKYAIRRDSTASTIVLTNTEKIDSALILLPFYRDKLKKVSDNEWSVRYYEEKNK